MKKIVESFKALGEENRIRIVQMLCKEEMCVCELIEHLGSTAETVVRKSKRPVLFVPAPR